MMTLIVEDTDQKYEKLKGCVLECCANATVTRAKDSAEALRSLISGRFDLMLLDVRLPMVFGLEPSDEASSSLLNDIRRKLDRRKWPTIIGTTQFEESFPKGDAVFAEFVSRVVLVSDSDPRWQRQIDTAIRVIMAKASSASLMHNSEAVDVAIVTALKTPEFEMILDAFGTTFTAIDVSETSERWLNYTLHLADGRQRKLVCACASEMGMCAMASLVTRLIIVSRPRALILTGIMGGNKERVGLGDLIISEETWDFRAGKISDDGFQPDVKSRPCDARLKRCFENTLTEHVLDEIWRSWPGEKPPSRTSLKSGATACSAAVIADASSFEEMERQKRKVVGVEMEALGCYDAAHQIGDLRPEVICVKSVCDLGDSQKNDKYQRYCAYLAAQAVKAVVSSPGFEGSSS